MEKKLVTKKKVPKVYCSHCRFYLNGKMNPLHRGVCLATAALSGDAISEEGDVVGLAIPAERNRRNNCTHYRKTPFLKTHLHSSQREAILRVMRAPIAETPAAAVASKTKVSKAKQSDIVAEAAKLAAEMLATILETTLQPLVDRLDHLEEHAHAKVDTPNEGLGEGTRLPPYIRRGSPRTSLDQITPPRRAALDPIEGEQPDVIGGPM